MQTASSQFELELQKRIRVEIVRLSDILVGGQSIKDFSEYRHIVGQILALGRVLEEFCEDVNKTINER